MQVLAHINTTFSEGSIEAMISVVQFAVGITFLSAGASKARRPLLFDAHFSQLGIPSVFRRPSWLGIVVAEVTLGLALLLSFHTYVAAVLATILCIVFLSVSVQLYRNDSPIPCMCFGGDEDEPVSIVTLLRITLLLLACIAITASHADILVIPVDVIFGTAQWFGFLGDAMVLLIVVAWLLNFRVVAEVVTRCRRCSSVNAD